MDGRFDNRLRFKPVGYSGHVRVNISGPTIDSLKRTIVTQVFTFIKVTLIMEHIFLLLFHRLQPF